MFNRQKGARQNQVFVGTTSNVVAALSLRSGATVWRQVLDKEEKISQLQHAGNVVVSVSTSARTLRAWSVEDGALIWDTHLKPLKRASAASEILVIGATAEAGSLPDIAVLHDDTVTFRDAKTGQMQWSWSGAEGEQLLKLGSGPNGELFVLVGSGTGSVSVQEISIKTGKAAGSAKALSGSYKSDTQYLTSDAHIVMASEEGCGFGILALGTSDVQQFSFGQGPLEGLDCKVSIRTTTHAHPAET